MVIRPQTGYRPNYNMYNQLASARQPSFSQQDGYLYALNINQQYTDANEAQNLLRTVQAIRQATYDSRLGSILNLRKYWSWGGGGVGDVTSQILLIMNVYVFNREF